ncbi:MAG: hypothetical protein EXS36_14275 [Pedosphaera sp.]|nr:hypothetical protein [Pedosphaera sp.]
MPSPQDPSGNADAYRDPFRNIFRVPALMAVCLIVAVMASGPVYKKFKVFRGRSFAKQLERLVTNSPPDIVECNRLVKIILAIAPEDPAVLRATAHYCVMSRIDAGFNYWEMLVAKPGAATRADRIEYIRFALAMNRMEAAQAQLKQLLAENPKDAEGLQLSVQLFTLRREPGRAENMARFAVTSYPFDERMQVVLSQALASSTKAVKRAEGRRVLWPLAVGDGPMHNTALSLLISNSELTRGENTVLLHGLESGTNRTTTSLLQAASLKLKIDPTNHHHIVQKTIDEVSQGADEDRLRSLRIWLVHQRQYEALLRVLPAEIASQTLETASIRLGALAELGRWSELRSLLADTGNPADASHRQALRGLLATREGKTNEIAPSFELALKMAGNYPQRVRVVAKTAEFARQTNAALAAWNRLLQYSPMALDASRHIIALQQNAMDPRALRSTMQRMATFFPSDPIVISFLAYYQLLLDDHVADTRAQLRTLSEQDPKQTEIRFALAMAELKSGDAGTAVTLIEQPPFKFEDLAPHWQVVYVAALGASEQREAARQNGRKLDLRRLNEEEQKLVRPYR